MRRLGAAAVLVVWPALALAQPVRETAPAAAGGLALGGYLQIDAIAYHQASEAELSPAGAPLNETRFLLRRGRLAVVYARGVVGGALQIDSNTINGLVTRPVNAELSVTWAKADEAVPRVAGTLGLTRIPFGREVVEAERERFFLERSNVAQALFPGVWDLGVKVEGGWRTLRYALALMNGEPIGEQSFPGRDPNRAKDLLGRLGVAMARGTFLLEAGASGLKGTGFHPGTPATKDTLVWRDVNEDGIVQSTEIQVIGGSAASASSTFERFALGADLRASVGLPRLGPLEVMAEVFWASNLDRGLLPSDPVASARNVRQLGYYLGLTQQLTPHARIGVRYDHYQPDADGSERLGAALVPRNNRFATLALAAAFILGPDLRFVLEYDHNWNALGRWPSGRPRTLGRDAVTLRGQVVF